ncbi:thrombospondin type 3 repeat-containing protein [Deinococcus sp. S9]|uniref:thrombospondin type 3 repeat-containing protein n=1 Tax=Deinococcus sp. S9 TaxID=2545754 RepID=UPI001054C527|nr:thrombospondin type 3 repeat-containing protein [Deinococcus sp. S9]TDE84656.1 hypothetical protein E0686_16020 [Deinococcus sp. S9]
MLRTLLFLLIATGGVAAAEAAPKLPFPALERGSMVLRDLATEEISAAAGQLTPRGNPAGETFIRKALPVGRFFRSPAGIFVASSLVSASLQWFYNELKRQSGTALDDWWNQADSSSPVPGAPPLPQSMFNQVDIYPSGPAKPCYSGSDLVGWAAPGRGGSAGNSWVGVFTISLDEARMIPPKWNLSTYRIEWGDANQWLDYSLNVLCGPVTAPEPQKPLDSVLPKPGVADAVRNIAADFLQAHPEAGPAYIFKSNPDGSQMYTPDGRRVNLNPNEYADNPYLDPSLDTDGDHYTDADEASQGSDPDDPNSIPNGKPYVRRVTTTTTTNPDGSTTKTTTTEYSDGSKKVVKVTVKKEEIKNPDGSTTTRTTTTTETQYFKPDGSPDGPPDVKQKVEEETTPPEEQPKDEETCKAKGGTWQNSTCTMPQKETPPDGDLSAPEGFKLPDLSKLRTNFDANAQKLADEVKNKLPFGISAKWFPRPSSVAANCPEWPVTLGILEMTFRPCDTKVAQDAHSIVRPVLAGILTIMFGIAAARIVGRA